MPYRKNAFPDNPPELTVSEMLELVKKAEELRQLQCIRSSRSYLRKVCRERGITPEEYIATKDPRGSKLRYFPDGKNVLQNAILT